MLGFARFMGCLMMKYFTEFGKAERVPVPKGSPKLSPPPCPIPAKTCHLMDWLQAADPVFGGKQITEKLERPQIFDVLAFMTGWCPEENPISMLDNDLPINKGLIRE